MGPLSLPQILASVRPPQAVAAFNFMNLEDVRGIIAAAEAENTPVVIQASENAARHSGLDYLAAMGTVAARRASVPVCLHLDHATDFGIIIQAVKLGFSSVMVDGSRLPFPENAAIAADVVRVAHSVGVSVEAELGRVGGKEDGVGIAPDEHTLVNPDEAAEFVQKTGVDALAPAVGTIHGLYRGTPMIRFDLIEEVYHVTGVPLVLHGGSGIPEVMVREAIQRGIRKFNVGTDLQIAHANALKAALEETAKAPNMRKAGSLSVDAICEVARAKIRMCSGASGEQTVGGQLQLLD